MSEAKLKAINEPSDVETGHTTDHDLSLYLHKNHGCWFANFNGRYHLQSSRDPDKGGYIGRNLSFDDMMAIALARPTE